MVAGNIETQCCMAHEVHYFQSWAHATTAATTCLYEFFFAYSILAIFVVTSPIILYTEALIMIVTEALTHGREAKKNVACPADYLA